MSSSVRLALVLLVSGIVGLAVAGWARASTDEPTRATLTVAVGEADDSTFLNDRAVVDLRGLLRADEFVQQVATATGQKPADVKDGLSSRQLDESRFVEIRYDAVETSLLQPTLTTAATSADGLLTETEQAEFTAELAAAEANLAIALAEIDDINARAEVPALRPFLAELDRQLSVVRNQQSAAVIRGEDTSAIDGQVETLAQERESFFELEQEMLIAERARDLAQNDRQTADRRLSQLNGRGGVITEIGEIQVVGAQSLLLDHVRAGALAAMATGAVLLALLFVVDTFRGRSVNDELDDPNLEFLRQLEGDPPVPENPTPPLADAPRS